MQESDAGKRCRKGDGDGSKGSDWANGSNRAGAGVVDFFGDISAFCALCKFSNFCDF
jgi:hypothetical protein